MNPKQFEEFVKQAQAKQLSILGCKSEEYSSDTDKFANCRIGARRKGKTPAKIADDWQSKHDVSIEMILDGTIKPTRELLEEKFTDSINWLYIKWALLLEEVGEEAFKDFPTNEEEPEEIHQTVIEKIIDFVKQARIDQGIDQAVKHPDYGKIYCVPHTDKTLNGWIESITTGLIKSEGYKHLPFRASDLVVDAYDIFLAWYEEFRV